MNKFIYEAYGVKAYDAGPFEDTSSYTNPANEQESRRQLSYPLNEIKAHINATNTIRNDNENDVIQFNLTSDGLIQYRDSISSTWSDTASSGHIIYGSDNQPVTQKTKMKFANSTVENVGDTTVVNGITGPQGPQGIQGVTYTPSVDASGNISWSNDGGRANPQTQNIMGPQGPSGPQGETGATGSTGPQGPQGIQGLQGPAGVAGQTGPQGPAGQNGAQGPQGQKGDKGDSGNDFTIKGLFATLLELKTAYPEGTSHPEREGWAYFIGTEGSSNPIYLWDNRIYEWIGVGYLQGPQGPQGPQGETGATGSTGPQGPQGVQGQQGPQGVQGPQGDTGPQGPQGPTGAGMLTGGTINQIMVKNSSTDYDMSWGTVDGLLVFNTAYDASSNKIATMADITTAITNAIGGSY